MRHYSDSDTGRADKTTGCRRAVAVCSTLCTALLLSSCQFASLDAIVSAPAFIREAAYAEAERYLGMEYEWGGQDLPRGIDCSGLVVNVYHTVTAGTEYAPPFDDATAAMLSERYTVDIDVPARGDLVFMGDGAVSHVAILDRLGFDENGDERVYFIDAYSAAPGGGRVMERSYPADSPVILSYGRLLVIRHGQVR